MQSANRLTNAALDPISRMPEFKVCAVRVELPPSGATRMSAKRRLVVVGNGMAGARLVEECSRAAAAIASTSRCSATSRAATTTASCCRACSPAATDPKDIFINPLSWYAANGVTLHAGVRVEAIDVAAKTGARGAVVTVRAVIEPYDTLVIAPAAAR